MHIKSLLIGFLLGIAATIAAGYVFGDDLRGTIAHGTAEVGQGVQKAGEALERQGEKLR